MLKIRYHRNLVKKILIKIVRIILAPIFTNLIHKSIKIVK